MDKLTNYLDCFDREELITFARIDIDKAEYESALFKLKYLINSDNALTEAISMTARLYAQIGLFEKSEHLFRRYLELDKNGEIEQFQLGMSLFDQGKHDEALTEWDKLLEKHPLNPPALFYKGLVLAQKNQTVEAQKLMETILKNIPNDNLYFARAQELTQELKVLATAESANMQSNVSFINKDAYKTIQ